MPAIPQDELIAYAKTFLKAKGFLKKKKRWIKDIGEFTLCFYIQGSCYSAADYYVRPGVFINALKDSIPTIYGHIWTELYTSYADTAATMEQIMAAFEDFCAAWSNSATMKATMDAFAVWDARNPLEKRRANLVDYEADPPPSVVCFSISDEVKAYILEHF